MANYVASKNVVFGKPDEHAYNLFLKVMGIFHKKLKLWHTELNEQKLYSIFQRATEQMRWERMRRKRVAQASIIHGPQD